MTLDAIIEVMWITQHSKALEFASKEAYEAHVFNEAREFYDALQKVTNIYNEFLAK